MPFQHRQCPAAYASSAETCSVSGSARHWRLVLSDERAMALRSTVSRLSSGHPRRDRHLRRDGGIEARMLSRLSEGPDPRLVAQVRLSCPSCHALDHSVWSLPSDDRRSRSTAIAASCRADNPSAAAHLAGGTDGLRGTRPVSSRHLRPSAEKPDGPLKARCRSGSMTKPKGPRACFFFMRDQVTPLLSHGFTTPG